jgi:hypothetical protein
MLADNPPTAVCYLQSTQQILTNTIMGLSLVSVRQLNSLEAAPKVIIFCTATLGSQKTTQSGGCTCPWLFLCKRSLCALHLLGVQNQRCAICLTENILPGLSSSSGTQLLSQEYNQRCRHSYAHVDACCVPSLL